MILKVRGVIDPVVAQCVKHGLDTANSTDAPLVIILEDKLSNDAVAYLQTIAQQRGRNVDWAEAAVRWSAPLTAQQAVARQVVDLIADDLTDLLTQLEGRRVTTPSSGQKLELTAVAVEEHPMTWLEVIAHGLVDSNIAYLLLSLGTIALIAEFYNPGAVLPGVLRRVCRSGQLCSRPAVPL
jgi:membrane-bound serine protease (ClpP class)